VCHAALGCLCGFVSMPSHESACAVPPCMQIAIVIMHLSRLAVNSDAIVILMALQCILLWLRLQYYLRCAQAQPCILYHA